MTKNTKNATPAIFVTFGFDLITCVSLDAVDLIFSCSTDIWSLRVFKRSLSCCA